MRKRVNNREDWGGGGGTIELWKGKCKTSGLNHICISQNSILLLYILCFCGPIIFMTYTFKTPLDHGAGAVHWQVVRTGRRNVFVNKPIYFLSHSLPLILYKKKRFSLSQEKIYPWSLNVLNFAHFQSVNYLWKVDACNQKLKSDWKATLSILM